MTLKSFLACLLLFTFQVVLSSSKPLISKDIQHIEKDGLHRESDLGFTSEAELLPRNVQYPLVACNLAEGNGSLLVICGDGVTSTLGTWPLGTGTTTVTSNLIEQFSTQSVSNLVGITGQRSLLGPRSSSRPVDNGTTLAGVPKMPVTTRATMTTSPRTTRNSAGSTSAPAPAEPWYILNGCVPV